MMSETIKDEAFPVDDSTGMTSPVVPILLVAASSIVLIGMITRKTDSPIKDPDVIIDLPVEQPFFEELNDSSSSNRSSFYKNVRSKMNASSIHGIDQLLSLTLVPLITSTVIRAMNMIKSGQLTNLDDVRTYTYLNLYLKSEHDFSVQPVPTIAMIGHYASIFGSGNLGNLANISNAATEFNRLPYYDRSFMSRGIEPFTHHVSNPSYENPNLGAVEAINIASPSPNKAFFVDNGLTRIVIPNLIDHDGNSLFTSNISGTIIRDILQSDPTEYEESFFKNLMESPLWLDDPTFYKRINMLSEVKDDSSFRYIVKEGILPSSWFDFEDKVANTNMISTLPSRFINRIFEFLSHSDSQHSELRLSSSIGGDLFGHYLTLIPSINYKIPGEYNSGENTNTERNFSQLMFSIVDDIIINGLTNSLLANDGFIPSYFSSNSVISDYRLSKWNIPLFTALKTTYVYFPPITGGE